jgi:hypothetical protein
MSTPNLSEHLVNAGQQLLAALDSAGLGGQGAAWIYDHALGDWRYVVATSLIETMGRSKVYKQLLSVLKKLNVPDDLTIDDVHLLSTEGSYYRDIASAIRVEGNSLIRFQNCSINGRMLDAIVYRWGGGPPTLIEKAQTASTFKRRAKELIR